MDDMLLLWLIICIQLMAFGAIVYFFDNRENR